MDNKSNSVENKSSTSEELPTDSTQQQTEYRRTSSVPDTGFPMNPFDFSSVQNLLNDPTIKDMAEQISKNPVVCEMIVDMSEQIAEDPVYSQMVEQHQKSVPSTGQDIIPPLDPQQLISTVQQLSKNPKLMKMSQHLRNAIMQDPVLSSMIGSKEQIEEQIARIKKNRALKGVLEEK